MHSVVHPGIHPSPSTETPVSGAQLGRECRATFSEKQIKHLSLSSFMIREFLSPLLPSIVHAAMFPDASASPDKLPRLSRMLS